MAPTPTPTPSTVLSPTPSAPNVTPSPTFAPTPSPGSTGYLVVMAEGIDASNNVTSIRLLDSNGHQVQSWALKSGVQVLGAAGNRIFVDSSHELKAIDSEGTVEDLGPLGEYAWTFVARSDGHRWAWITPAYADGPASDIHLAGDGVSPRVFRVSGPLGLTEWDSQGVLLRVPWGVGDYWPFGIWLSKESDLLNPETGARTLINVSGQCSVTDVASTGAYACLTGGMLGEGSPAARLRWPDGITTNVQLPQPAFSKPGALAFSPTGTVASVGGVTGGAVSPGISATGESYSTALISKDGSLRLLGPAQARPAFGGGMSDPPSQSWLPDGRFLMWRPKGAAGGASGLYWLTMDGAAAFVQDDGHPVGVLTPG